MKAISAALFALLAAAGTAGAQETTLSAVVFVPRNTTFGEIFVRFVEQVNKEGKGILQISLRGGPDAIPTFEQGNALRTGVVDMVSHPVDVLYQRLPGVRRADPAAAHDAAAAQDGLLDRAAEVHQPEGQRAARLGPTATASASTSGPARRR